MDRSEDADGVATFVVQREEGLFVARCPELDIVTCADTIDRLMANAVGTIEVYFEAARKMGCFDREAARVGVAPRPGAHPMVRLQATAASTSTSWGRPISATGIGKDFRKARRTYDGRFYEHRPRFRASSRGRRPAIA